MTLHTFTIHSQYGSQLQHKKATAREALEAYVNTLDAFDAEAVATIVCHDNTIPTETMSFKLRREVFIDGTTRTTADREVQLQAEIDVLRGVGCGFRCNTTAPPCGACVHCARGPMKQLVQLVRDLRRAERIEVDKRNVRGPDPFEAARIESEALGLEETSTKIASASNTPEWHAWQMAHDEWFIAMRRLNDFLVNLAMGEPIPPDYDALETLRLELEAVKTQRSLLWEERDRMHPIEPGRWYSIDEHGAVETHDSEAEARAGAQYTIDNALQDHWPEGMHFVQWGYLHALQTCEEKDRVDAPPKPDGFKSAEEHATATAARDAWIEERGDVEWWCRYTLENTPRGDQYDGTKALAEIAEAKLAVIIANGAESILHDVRTSADHPDYKAMRDAEYERWLESHRVSAQAEALLNEHVDRACDDKIARELIKTTAETDLRWIADVESMPGVMTYGKDENEAVYLCTELVKKVLIDRRVAGES